MLAAITARTKLVFVAAPNNPTGTTTTRAELDAYFARVPAHVLTVVDQAYFEYIDDPDYPDGDRGVREGRAPRARPADVLEDLRARRARASGTGSGRRRSSTAIGKVRRAFDVSSPAQEAALASLDDDAELARRRGANREAMALLEDVLRAHGLDPAEPGGRELRLRRASATPPALNDGAAAARA